MGKWTKIIIYILVFGVCLALVIAGQKTVGLEHLLMQIIGLAGMLALLYSYNKKYQ